MSDLDKKFDELADKRINPKATYPLKYKYRCTKATKGVASKTGGNSGNVGRRARRRLRGPR